MKLYHSSTLVIKEPDIHYGRKNADFGQGFYLSPQKEFALKWATAGSFINEYELDITGLDLVTFSRDIAWFKYIFGNRRLEDTIEADVVIGPIANDTLYETFGFITSGYLGPDEALRLLKIGPEYTQVVIKTEKAAKNLKWLDAEQIAENGHAKAMLKKEELEFQTAFASALKEMEEDLDG